MYHKLLLVFLAAMTIAFCGFGCTSDQTGTTGTPGNGGQVGPFGVVPDYPDQPWDAIIAKGQSLSDDLQAYVNDWFEGKVDSKIPANLLPGGSKPNEIGSYYLCKANEVDGNDQFFMRAAEYPVDPNSMLANHWDPHCTYIFGSEPIAPFGTTVLIKGQFPKCRFFSVQVSAPLDRVTYYQDWTGRGEIPIVDVDIIPDAGSVNPFLIGADRSATNRNYTLRFPLAIGNTADLNPQCIPPQYRHSEATNTRYASFLNYGGPWHVPGTQNFIPAYGQWGGGQIWIRNYVPDPGCEKWGGVNSPKIEYELPAGHKYFGTNYYIRAEIDKLRALLLTRRASPTETPVSDPMTSVWWKEIGIILVIAEGMYDRMGLNDWSYIRALNRAITGMGESQPAPGNWEWSATCGSHFNYLVDHRTLGSEMVLTLSGKLPTFPRTRQGQSLQQAEMRYWSVSGYYGNVQDPSFGASAIHSVCDEEMVLDANNRYVIAYSRASEKPTNATSAAGVTWVNWGPQTGCDITLRWVSVSPEWAFSLTPNEVNLPWTKVAQSGCNFDPNLIGSNKHDGFLGDYKPVWNNIPKAAFEGFGSPVTVEVVEGYAPVK